MTSEIRKAIDFLKENGYKVIKSENVQTFSTQTVFSYEQYYRFSEEGPHFLNMVRDDMARNISDLLVHEGVVRWSVEDIPGEGKSFRGQLTVVPYDRFAGIDPILANELRNRKK